MPEKLFSGNAFVICAILARERGRIAGPPRPPVETKPSTFISNSSVSGSISGSEVNVLDEEIASAPPRKAARASTTMSVVEGVSFAQTGTFATSLTTWVTTEMSSWSLPMFDPMSWRSMWGQERFSSSASAPSSWQAFASVCQCDSSVSLPEPAMMEATSTRSGNAFLIRPMRGTHQSSVLSEISSQFHDECSAVPGRFFIERRGLSTSARRNFVLAPAHVDDRMEPDGLGHDAAPAGLEGAQDVGFRLRRRRRGEQERVLEPDSGEDDRKIRAHDALRSEPFGEKGNSTPGCPEDIARSTRSSALLPPGY